MRRIALTLVVALFATVVAAQDSSRSQVVTGFRAAGLPNLNYNSDEGVGNGARISIFNQGRGGFNPYAFLMDGNLFLTAHGRRQAFLFFDAPHLLSGGHRLTAEARYQEYGAAPYYGIGNETRYVDELTRNENDAFVHSDYYAFDRRRATLWATYQRRIGIFRGVVGAGAVRT